MLGINQISFNGQSNGQPENIERVEGLILGVTNQPRTRHCNA
jgi:hypothetical protein